MNIYKIWQTSNKHYDVYDSAIVIAESPNEARLWHPQGVYKWMNEPEEHWMLFDSWVDEALLIQVELIGQALPEAQSGVVLASFNAG